MSQLGRIGGQALTDDLLRAGVDLAFETNLLYFNVGTQQIGINASPPIYDLDVTGNVRSINLKVDNQLDVGNIRINNSNTFTTSVGEINVIISGTEIFHNRLVTSNLIVAGNSISSINDSNILLDPNGAGYVNILSNSNVTGNLSVAGNINIDGNLTSLGTLTIGDNILDTVTVNTDFTQTIQLSNNELYHLGSSLKRWNTVYTTNSNAIGNLGDGIYTSQIFVSDQTQINGITSTITTIQSLEDLLLAPASGRTVLEKISINENEIEVTNGSPLFLQSTGFGYYLLAGNNGFVVPSGNNSERSISPEVGETRWNTEKIYLECFDGNVWSISTGGGETVTQEVMTDLGNVYSLILG
jgi:hypothetical protein